jgi:hypothetical protein
MIPWGGPGKANTKNAVSQHFYFYFALWLTFCKQSSAKEQNKKPSAEMRMVSVGFAERGGFEPPVQLPIRQFSKLLV